MQESERPMRDPNPRLTFMYLLQSEPTPRLQSYEGNGKAC